MRPSSAHSPEGGRPARHFSSASRWLPLATLLLGLGCLAFWATRGPGIPLRERLPGTDRAPGTGSSGASNAVLAGRLIMGTGRPSNLPGLWPGFRGPERTGFISGSAPLVRAWEAAGPRPVWSIEAGEGYAGPAVANGRVYLMDYDREGKRDAIRCLSLDDGREIWRYAYPISIKRNHGMSRTVPTVRDNLVVAMGPKCHVTCLDAQSGELRWGIDLVQQFGATVPAWYRAMPFDRGRSCHFGSRRRALC
ncbi:MAG: PQQ-binding-like beta-propeller repeat protein [Verrucomicrobiota bacterium]